MFAGRLQPQVNALKVLTKIFCREKESVLVRN